MTQPLVQAVEILKHGGLVAFPTETVYGLGADATNPAAVQRVFDVKGRPATNPVIVHVADADVARRYTSAWPQTATKLVETFWPGPLTLVLPRTDAIVPAVTAGRNTVGVRAPDHPLTLELLRQFAGPLIGPSANRSSRVSPTTAEHVRDELGSLVDLILDGGPCKVGIESTVLDLSAATPTILRPGAVSREQIQRIIGPVMMINVVTAPDTAATSPGQHALHYAPITPTYRFEPNELEKVISSCSAQPDRQFIVMRVSDLQLERPNVKLQEMPASAAEYARQMYAALRHADRQSPAAIWIEMPPDDPDWFALRDRLTRASRPLS